MKERGVIGIWIILLTLSLPLLAQYETLLIRFSPDVSALSMALGGQGSTLFARADGIHVNPALASSLNRAVLEINGYSDTLGGALPEQLDSETKRDYLFDLAGNALGLRSLVMALPWKWQNLTVSFCGGWNRAYPYGYDGQGDGLWRDQNGVLLGTDRTTFSGSGVLHSLWLGGAVAFQDFFGFGVTHSLWRGTALWQTAYQSDLLDEADQFNGRRERIKAVSWTVGAFFRPVDLVLFTASIQSRCGGDFAYSFFDDPETSAAPEIEEEVTTITIPEAVTFGLRIGPVYRTALHAEYHTRLWRTALVENHPNGSVFPAYEVGESSQQNTVVFSLGLSHRLTIAPSIDCILAAGLGWEQPLFNSSLGEALVLNRINMGLSLQLGPMLAVSAAYRRGSGQWPKLGKFNDEDEYEYVFSRSTLMLSFDLTIPLQK